jgi:glutaminyl-tRNA synthetase
MAGPMIDDNKPQNFLAQHIQQDLSAGNLNKLITRFPPEPNGYLHIGHAKSICLNFGLAEEFGGECNLRFDDTNPAKEDQEYIDAIISDVRWLGFNWAGDVRYA